MTRCSYIPPEGQSVIAIAKERGGTTDGDIQALVDRFGCQAEAEFQIERGDADEPDDLIDACRDHVGHMLGEGGCWVAPIAELSDLVSVTVDLTCGVAREGFGSPMILASKAWSNASPDDRRRDITTATPVVDLGTNPTREQVEAAGFSSDSAAYREARAAFLATAGGSLEGIRAALLTAVPGVTAAHVQQAGSGDVRVYVDGGDEHDILWCLYQALPLGVVSLGNVRGRIENDGAHHELAFSRGAPPYAVGDEVEWCQRAWYSDTGYSGWLPGRVTYVFDDRPNDGIDKPFWIVRVDTAGERRFAGPAVAVCLRHLAKVPVA